MMAVALSSCAGNGAENGLTNGENDVSIEGAASEYRRISSEEAMQKMEEGEPFILLDVRTESEFTEGHIEGAVLIPDYELESRAGDELFDKDVTILIYCRTGRRSEAAARQLIEMGYRSVYDFGGIVEWPFDIIQ